MSKYVWCEDSRSGFVFWTALFHELFPDIVVESKKNNTNLRKAVSDIQDDGNQYFILLDNALDNPDVLREVKMLTKLSRQKSNVTTVRVHSFEFVLLSFKKLEEWVFAKHDELKEQRRELLHWRDVLVRALTSLNDASVLGDVKDALRYGEKYNSEQVAAKLLYEITRNTGFETTKGKIGDCFIVDCCDWADRQPDDICGLDADRISSAEKMRSIYESSMLSYALTEAGLSYDYDI